MTPGAVYTGELAEARGGIRNGNAYLDNVDLTLEADLDALLGIQGGTLMIYVLGNSGGSASKYAGDMQGVSNIDSPKTWELYEFWYQQNWAADRYLLKAGLYDFNSEFDSISTAGLFINSSHGIGPDIAQTGENLLQRCGVADAALGGERYSQGPAELPGLDGAGQQH